MWRYVVGSLVGIVESFFVFGGQKWEELISEWDAIYLACKKRTAVVWLMSEDETV
jgi:hypothetical protein